MARITRKHQKIFALDAANNGQIGSLQTDDKVLSDDLDVLQALDAWLEGFNEMVVSGQQLPALEELQALSYIATYQMAYLFQEGIPEWNTSTTYYQKSVVKKAGTYQLYGSITDNNTGNALTDATKWQFLIDLSAKQDVAEVDVASGGTTNIFAATSNNVRITGTTAITAFDASDDNAGITKRVRFADALVLTYHATNLIIQGGANYTTATGDEAYITSMGAGKVLIRWIERFDGSNVIDRQGANIVSADIINIGASPNKYIKVTGNTAITSFGSNPANARGGIHRIIEFTGSLVLTHSGSLLLPNNGANIVTQPGDICEVVSVNTGTADWKVLSYFRFDGTPINQIKGSDTPSADIVTVANVAGDFIDITGTTTITSLGNAPRAGIEKTIRFKGALILTHNATSLILPTGENIVTSDGDVAIFRSLGGANWFCVNYLAKPFQSSETAVVVSSNIEVNHGLGMIPRKFTAVLRCKEVDAGYAVGDEVLLPLFYFNSATNLMTCVYANATKVGISNRLGYILVNKTTFAEIGIVASKWKLIFRAEKF